MGWVGLDLYVCGLGWVVGYENGPMDNSETRPVFSSNSSVIAACNGVSNVAPPHLLNVLLRVYRHATISKFAVRVNLPVLIQMLHIEKKDCCCYGICCCVDIKLPIAVCLCV